LRALAMRDGDETHVAQRLHCFTNRRPADLEALYQLALGRHVIARLQFAAGDEALQPDKDLIGKLAPDDRFRTVHRRESLLDPVLSSISARIAGNAILLASPQRRNAYLLAKLMYSLYQMFDLSGTFFATPRRAIHRDDHPYLSHRNPRKHRSAGCQDRQRPIDRHLRRAARRNRGAEGAGGGAGAGDPASS